MNLLEQNPVASKWEPDSVDVLVDDLKDIKHDPEAEETALRAVDKLRELNSKVKQLQAANVFLECECRGLRVDADRYQVLLEKSLTPSPVAVQVLVLRRGYYYNKVGHHISSFLDSIIKGKSAKEPEQTEGKQNA